MRDYMEELIRDIRIVLETELDIWMGIEEPYCPLHLVPLKRIQEVVEAAERAMNSDPTPLLKKLGERTNRITGAVTQQYIVLPPRGFNITMTIGEYVQHQIARIPFELEVDKSYKMPSETKKP